MITSKTEEVLEQALIRVAATGNGNIKEEVLVHLVSDERCFSGLAMPTSQNVQDVTKDCVDLLADIKQEEVKPKYPDCDAKTQTPNHQGSLRPNFSLPSVVIHGASSSNSSTTSSLMSPKTNKKKKKKSKVDDSQSNSTSARSQSFHVRSPCRIPLLKLPDDDDDVSSTSLPPPIHVEAATSDEGESVEAEEIKNVSKKRRKSLVNLLFSSKNESTTSTGHNSLDAGMAPHGGQRLHFRRLSDIICRLGGNKDEEKATLNLQTSKDDSDVGMMDSPSGIAGGGTAGLTLRQLFPYRRRRSSVSHLDNTDQFRETKEEYLMSARRRMSSFPPSDGDESAIVLEKIHSMGKIDIGMPPATPTEGSGTPNSHSSPFKLLRRGPGGLFPTSKSKKSKWKSSTDIPTSMGSNPFLACNNNNNNSGSNSNINNISNNSSNPPSDSQCVNVVNKSAKDSGSNNKRSGWGQSSTSSSSSSSFLRPNFPLMSRRGSSPLESELNAFRKTISEGPGEPTRNVVVFPRRKLEDVPGIFIPGRSKVDSVSNLLGVRSFKDDDRRRHSISDPILVQQQISAIKQLPALRPRSYNRDTR